MFGPDGDNVAVVEPDALEDELEHVPFGFRVGVVAPEEGEVVEDLLGLAVPLLASERDSQVIERFGVIRVGGEYVLEHLDGLFELSAGLER